MTASVATILVLRKLIFVTSFGGMNKNKLSILDL